MPRALIVIGASAGGVRVLLDVVSRLQADIPAAIMVVIHLPPYHRSQLPELLSKAGPLPAASAEDGELIRDGYIYVAPPDRHMLVRDGRIELNRGRGRIARAPQSILCFAPPLGAIAPMSPASFCPACKGMARLG
jgi:two-component system chemotaxis response regulator CheB